MYGGIGWWSQRPEALDSLLVLEPQALVSCLTWCWVPNLGLLKEKYMFLTTEPSLQPCIHITVYNDNSPIFLTIQYCIVRMSQQFIHSKWLNDLELLSHHEICCFPLYCTNLLVHISRNDYNPMNEGSGRDLLSK